VDIKKNTKRGREREREKQISKRRNEMNEIKMYTKSITSINSLCAIKYKYARKVPCLNYII
jgi:hypothetical protein